MEDRTMIVLMCFGFLLVIGSSEAVQCYKCGSLLSSDAKCEDPFKAEGVGGTTCSGSCAKYKGETDGAQLVWRTCNIAPMKDHCESQEAFGVDVDVCFCNSYLCNAATTSRVTFMTFLTMMIVGVWYSVYH